MSTQSNAVNNVFYFNKFIWHTFQMRFNLLFSFILLFPFLNIQGNDRFPLSAIEYTCYEKAAFSIGEDGVTDKIPPTREAYYLDLRSWKNPSFGLKSYGLSPKKTELISSTLRYDGNWVGAYSIETSYNPEILTVMYDKDKVTLGAVVTTAQGSGRDHYTRNTFYYCGNS